MNIKSLLLGSAAALVAVSGARAADAVVIAEPEPMEYVRVCDVYGSGFYYIPGTETCLSIDGYFRFDLGFGENTGRDIDANGGQGPYNDGDTYKTRFRAALRWDARSETEYGTLQGYAHVNFDYDNGYITVPTSRGLTGVDNSGTNVNINHAWIDLAGFRVGKSDSYFSTITGYSSGVSNDGFLVSYGPFDTQFISYTFTGGNGFTATIALENGAGFGDTTTTGWGAIDDYVPHVVGGFSWTQGWGGLSAVAAYDANREQGAFKARLDVNVTDALSLFVMGGYSTNEAGNAYATWNGQWMIYGGGAWKFNEKATGNFEIAYSDWEDFHVVANVDYELVPDLHIIPEIVYSDNFGNGAYPTFSPGTPNGGVRPSAAVGGFLRIQRNF